MRPIASAPGIPVAVPWQPVASSLGYAFLLTIMFLASCAPIFERSPGYAILVVYLISWVFCVVLQAAGPMLRAARTLVAVDEGGVRCKIGSFSTYWPFALLGKGTIEGGLLFVPVLVLRDRSESPFVRLPLINSGGLEKGENVLAAYEARRAAPAPELPSFTAAFTRQGRDLGTWAGAIDALLRQAEGPGYRSATIDLDTLLSVVTDMRHAADLRAGAAYAVLKAGPAEMKALARRHLRPESPPLLLAMATLAEQQRAPGLDEAERFLDPEDRAALPR